MGQPRPPGRIWLLAVVEVAAAAVVAYLVTGRRDHVMANHAVPVAPWGLLEFGAGAVALAGLATWSVTRMRVSAVVAAVGFSVLAASPAVRILAVQSHFVAMAALEVLLSVVPLLLMAAWRPVSTSMRGRPLTTLFDCGAVLLFAGLLVGVHVPAVHHLAAHRGEAPLWVAIGAGVIGVGYWAAILSTTGRVRRALFFGTQEGAAFIGLLSLFGAWNMGSDVSPLGISAAWDQRLGGILMLATCVVVTVGYQRRVGA